MRLSARAQSNAAATVKDLLGEILFWMFSRCRNVSLELPTKAQKTVRGGS